MGVVHCSCCIDDGTTFLIQANQTSSTSDQQLTTTDAEQTARRDTQQIAESSDPQRSSPRSSRTRSPRHNGSSFTSTVSSASSNAFETHKQHFIRLLYDGQDERSNNENVSIRAPNTSHGLVLPIPHMLPTTPTTLTDVDGDTLFIQNGESAVSQVSGRGTPVATANRSPSCRGFGSKRNLTMMGIGTSPGVETLNVLVASRRSSVETMSACTPVITPLAADGRPRRITFCIAEEETPLTRMEMSSSAAECSGNGVESGDSHEERVPLEVCDSFDNASSSLVVPAEEAFASQGSGTMMSSVQGSTSNLAAIQQQLSSSSHRSQLAVNKKQWSPRSPSGAPISTPPRPTLA